MLVINAIKKLQKEHFKVTQDGNKVYAIRNNDIIEFHNQDGRVICIRTRGVSDKDDIYTDYSAGVYCDNISQAIAIS